MGTTTKQLHQLLDLVNNDELVLPEIQRDFIWDRKNVLLLFDSLYRGLPIGYMLVWKAKRAVAEKGFKRSLKRIPGRRIDNFYGYLLDGQQRLTSIQLVRDGEDYYSLMFSLRPQLDGDPDSNRFSYAARWNSGPWFVPVSEVLEGTLKPLVVIENLKKADDFDYHRDAEKIITSIAKLSDIMDRSIGIIEHEEDDYKKATELFIRFNSTGKNLRRSDLVAAELALTVPNLISTKIQKASTTIYNHYGFNFTKTFLIQCLSAVHTDKVDHKKAKEVWCKSTEAQILKSWERTSLGIDRAIEFITGTVRWDSDAWLPSINALMPLIYLMSKKKFNAQERLMARQWLLLSSFYAIFSGSVYSELDRLFKGLKNEPSIDKLYALTKRYFYKINPDSLMSGRRTGAVMSLYISLLRNTNAKNWITHTPLDGSVVGHNAELQVHHIFPRSLLLKRGYKYSEINTFANYALINKDSNLDISDEEPTKYIKRLSIKKDDLWPQCFPRDMKLLNVKHYDEFICERQKVLARAFNDYIFGG